jgi:hypothetical protein
MFVATALLFRAPVIPKEVGALVVPLKANCHLNPPVPEDADHKGMYKSRAYEPGVRVTYKSGSLVNEVLLARLVVVALPATLANPRGNEENVTAPPNVAAPLNV